MKRPSIYTDEDVDGHLVRALTRRGWDVRRAVDTHPLGTDDEVHFDTAIADNRILLSNDEDMVRLAVERQRAGVAFPGVIYFHQEKFPTVGAILQALEVLAAKLEAIPIANRVHFL